MERGGHRRGREAGAGPDLPRPLGLRLDRPGRGFGEQSGCAGGCGEGREGGGWEGGVCGGRLVWDSEVWSFLERKWEVHTTEDCGVWNELDGKKITVEPKCQPSGSTQMAATWDVSRLRQREQVGTEI